MLILLGLAAWVFVSTGQPKMVHKLPDGSVLKLNSMGYSKKLRLYTGEFWQKPLDWAFGTNLPPKFRGGERNMRSFYPKGSVALCFIRYPPDPPTNKDSRPPDLVLVDSDGNERFCFRKLPVSPNAPVAAQAMMVRGWSNRKDKRCDEIIIWELPPSQDKKLRLKLYESRGRTNSVEFWIRNPLANASL